MARLGIACILAILLLPSSALATDLSKYPCTVFSYDVCFRLPVGTHVDYSVPVDFHLYNVAKGDEPIATIYIGNAPQRADTAVQPRENKTKYGTIKVYSENSASGEKLDIYIMPSAKDALIVNISASIEPSTRNELRELLSSFRPCTPISAGGQKCPLNNAWGQELTKAVLP